MVPGSSVEPLSPVLYRNIGSKLEDVSDPSSPNSLLPPPCQHGVSCICLIPTNSLPFCPFSTGMVWCVGPRPPCAWLQADPPPPPTCTPATSLPLRSHLSHLFSTLFFTSLSISLCLSTHLSSQRILHWSNECANSACCIKCGHPNKLHPLQGIGVIGSEAVLESPTELHFIASPVAGNHQSQSQLLKLLFCPLLRFPSGSKLSKSAFKNTKDLMKFSASLLDIE